MRMDKAFIIVILLSVNLACGKGLLDHDRFQKTEDLLVKEDIAGWTSSGSGWIANSMEELTAYINGAADIYYRHGFISGAHQPYQGTLENTGSGLELTIYDQGNESNASALYEDPELGLDGAIDWKGAGQTAKYIRYAGFSQVLCFYRGKHFVLLQINADTETSLDILKQFALNVDGKFK